VVEAGSAQPRGIGHRPANTNASSTGCCVHASSRERDWADEAGAIT